jgi:hypothetical protein
MHAAIVSAVAARFRTFGGGKVNPSNPISVALENKPPQFAAGVDIAEVVEFIVNEIAAATAGDTPNDTVDAMMLAEEFISGFEDDETQEGIPELLTSVRSAITRERVAMRTESLALAHLREVVDAWSRFDKPTVIPTPGCVPEDGGEIEDGDVVEWFSEWRERAKTIVENVEPLDSLHAAAPGMLAAMKRAVARIAGEWYDLSGDLESDIAGVLRDAIEAAEGRAKYDEE